MNKSRKVLRAIGKLTESNIPVKMFRIENAKHIYRVIGASGVRGSDNPTKDKGYFDDGDVFEYSETLKNGKLKYYNVNGDTSFLILDPWLVKMLLKDKEITEVY